MSKIDNILNSFSSGVEKFFYLVSYPFIKVMDKMALFWLKEQINEREVYVEFLEDAMKVQRISINDYIAQNKNLSNRLEKFEKCGESMTISHKEWLESEVIRLTKLIRDVCERNESLNSDNAKMLYAGNAIAELIHINKPKKRLTKKDKQVQAILDEWNECSKQWKI